MRVALSLTLLTALLVGCEVPPPTTTTHPTEADVKKNIEAPAPQPAATQYRAVRTIAGHPQHSYPLPGATNTVGELLNSELENRVRIEIQDDRAVLTVKLDTEEAIWGFGQRFDSFDLRGRSFEVWAEDGWNRTDTSYFAIPWFVSSAGYGLFVNSTGRLKVDIGETNPNELRIEIPEAGVEVRGFIGSPREVVEAYTELVGRPHPVPDWTFEPWLSRNSYLGAYEINRTIALMETNGMKAGAVVLEAWEEQLHNFRFETNRYPNPEGWIRKLGERGYHVICWTTPSIWPVGSTYTEAQRRGFITLNEDGSEHVTRWLENGREINFSIPEARDFWGNLHTPLIEMGVAGFKTDGGEHMPDPWFHNVHPFYYQRATLDAYARAGREGIAFARSGNPLVAGNSTFWGGDQEAEWRNLAVVVRGGLSAALSGLFYWSHDVGGYSGTPTKELYLRWLQIGAFSPMMQLHGISAREPWTFDAETLRIARGYFKAREKLQPYLVELAREARAQGHPMWRPLAWAFPDDTATYRIGDQFMLGDELLVAPILDEKNERSVYLPKGDWVDLWSGETQTGPKRLAVKTELATIPVYARAADAGKWKTLFTDVPLASQRPLQLAPAGDKNGRGVVPMQRYIRGVMREKLFYTIHNNTDEPVSGEAVPILPAGFKADSPQISFTAPAQGEARIEFWITLPELAPGSYDMTVRVRAGNRAAIAPPVTMVQPLTWKALGLFKGGVGSKQELDGKKPDFDIGYADRNGKEVRWRDVPLHAIQNDGAIALDKVVGNEGNSTCYAYTQIESETPRRARLHLGSGDSMAVWLNGARVFERNAHRNPDRDEDGVDIFLQRGQNDLLIRISRNLAQNTLYARISGAE